MKKVLSTERNKEHNETKKFKCNRYDCNTIFESNEYEESTYEPKLYQGDAPGYFSRCPICNQYCTEVK